MSQDRVGTRGDPRAPTLISGHAAKTKKRQPAMNRDPGSAGDFTATHLSSRGCESVDPDHGCATALWYATATYADVMGITKGSILYWFE